MPLLLNVLEALRAEPSLITACLYDSFGIPVCSIHIMTSENRKTCPEGRTRGPRSRREFPSVIRLVLHQDDFLGSVVLISDVQELKRRRNHLLLLAGILLVMALSIGGASGFLLQRKILKPISDLSLAMQIVGAEQAYHARVSISGSDEMARLGSGFNAPC